LYSARLFDLSMHIGFRSNVEKLRSRTSVVDPNRLCSDPDPDPGSHVRLDPDPAPEPNRIQNVRVGNEVLFSTDF